jgi:glycogen(starch) synthase
MRSTVRILFLTPLYVPCVGGLETFVRQLAPEVVSRGHDVAIITSHGRESISGFEYLDDIPVRRVDAHDVVEARDAEGVLRVELEILRFAREFDPDLVHSHDAGPVLWMYRRAARRERRPLVVTLHNVMTRKFASVLVVLAKMLRDADWVTGVSQAVVDDVLSYERSVASRMSVITNGIVPPVVDVSPIPDGPARLLCMGRLDEQKGFDVAITALALVRERHPNVRLVIAGDGPERNRLIATASGLGVDDSIDFLGTVSRSRVATLFRECAAVVMPSRFEGLPLVALEAAWAGRPVIAADAPGLSEAVVPGETALMVPPEDPHALASAIVRLLDSPDRAGALGRKARTVAAARYSLDRCADEYEALYNRVIGNAVC